MANHNHKARGKEKTFSNKFIIGCFLLTVLFSPDHYQHKMEETIFYTRGIFIIYVGRMSSVENQSNMFDICICGGKVVNKNGRRIRKYRVPVTMCR